MKKIFIVITLLSLAGCVTTPTADQLANADFGAHPDNYKEFVINFMRFRLKDPNSAKYEFKEPTQGYVNAAPIRGGGIIGFGYLISFVYNAKNSFGGYTGWQRGKILFNNGEVLWYELGINKGYEPSYNKVLWHELGK